MATGFAQAQNAECMTNLSIFSEHAKVKNYEAAYEPWKMVYETCPSLNIATFLYGERILKDKIKKSSGAEQEGYVKDILALHDASIVHFSNRIKLADVIIDKVLMKREHKMISNEDIYNDLRFTEDKANFKNPRALYLYFSSLVDLHKGGKKELQEVFDVYDQVIEKIEVENSKLTNIITKLLPKEDAGTLTKKEKDRLRVSRKNSESYGKEF